MCIPCLQVNLLRQRFEQALGADYHKFVDIDTIDGFQVTNMSFWPAKPTGTSSQRGLLEGLWLMTW